MVSRESASPWYDKILGVDSLSEAIEMILCVGMMTLGALSLLVVMSKFWAWLKQLTRYHSIKDAVYGDPENGIKG